MCDSPWVVVPWPARCSCHTWQLQGFSAYICFTMVRMGACKKLNGLVHKLWSHFLFFAIQLRLLCLSICEFLHGDTSIGVSWPARPWAQEPSRQQGLNVQLWLKVTHQPQADLACRGKVTYNENSAGDPQKNAEDQANIVKIFTSAFPDMSGGNYWTESIWTRRANQFCSVAIAIVANSFETTLTNRWAPFAMSRV